MEEAKKAFQFDLEVELEEDPNKAAKLLQKTEKDIQRLKTLLRQGVKSKSFEQLSTLLHGYVSLKEVLSKILNN